MHRLGYIFSLTILIPLQSLAEIDFSSCGYLHSNTTIPDVPATIVVAPVDGDDGDRIQAALDHVAALSLDASGFRGCVLLSPGLFEVREDLQMTASGVVLRGSGIDKTFVRGVGHDRRPLIFVSGNNDLVIDSSHARKIIDETVPAGATTLTLDSIAGLEIGSSIFVNRPSTSDWIKFLGMDRFGIAWKPGTRDIRWERRVNAIDAQSNQIEIDAPITTAIEARFGGGFVESFSWIGRVTHVGIENLALVSETMTDNPWDEDHAWFGVTMENVENAWVRQITFRHFAGSAVALWESTRSITVEDCISIEPISEIGGYRRHTFFTMGQQTLFLRCSAENGRHDFSVGHCAAGPNAFVDCEALEALDCSGPIESWASGVLYDNVKIDGNSLNLENRWMADQGTGWCAANCTIWQSNASEVRCFIPPGAENRATGIWSAATGDGSFDKLDEFVKPRSLFKAQLIDRLGGSEKASEHLGPIGQDYFGATNPSYSQAESFVADSNAPARTLRSIIRSASQRHPLPVDAADVLKFDTIAVSSSEQTRPPSPSQKLTLREGRLCIGDNALTGKRLSPIWWRGNIRPVEAPKFGPAITRFVPGRIGQGFTDDLDQLTDDLVEGNVSILEHHHGLWYDRRRDDHIRERRANGNVTPPFYEQPFARTGQGKAWDGLSKYDLSQLNPWYWNRLREFADLADEKGLVLFHQHMFQHNILEAGAHWADYPWRSANNINATDFPEPPPYISDKRIFQAHLFYDVTNAHRRKLHRDFIRKNLDRFADNSNVIHSVGAEFTGPLEFMQFWIDTIIDWRQETRHQAMVALSCTKDVQDAILTDPTRRQAVSVIDIRQWWYTSDGKLYAPEGGRNLSPRQHRRQLKPKSPSEESMQRSIREYRNRYPEKAILFEGAPR